MTRKVEIDNAESSADSTSGHPRTTSQFSLRSAFVLISIICVFCALLAAQFALLAFFYVMLVAVGMMSVDIFRDQVDRRCAALVLALAVLYVAFNVAAIAVVVALELWDLLGFVTFVATIGGPLAVTSGVLGLTLSQGRLHWLSAAGFLLWMACVALANAGLIFAAMASA